VAESQRCRDCAQELDAEQRAAAYPERLRGLLEELQNRKRDHMRRRLVEGESTPEGKVYQAKIEEAEEFEHELLTSFPELRAKRT